MTQARESLLQGTVDNVDAERHAKKLILRVQPDGTLRAYALMVGALSDPVTGVITEEVPVLIENERQLAIMLWGEDPGVGNLRVKVEPTQELSVANYGDDAGTPTLMRVAPTGELYTLLAGMDAGGTIDELLTTAQQILFVRPDHPYAQVGPYVLTNAGLAVTWNPGGTAAEDYEVYASIVNVSGAVLNNINLAVDVGRAGVNRFALWNDTLPNPGRFVRFWAFRMTGADQIVADCGAANGAHLLLEVNRMDRGA